MTSTSRLLPTHQQEDGSYILNTANEEATKSSFFYGNQILTGSLLHIIHIHASLETNLQCEQDRALQASWPA